MAWQWFILILGLTITTDAAKWSYEGREGPSHWASLFPDACSGRHQSPIDIKTEETIFNPNLKNFAIFHDPPRPGSKFLVHNNGHAVQVNTEGPFYVSNGGLPHIYSTAQFHFHWGHKSHHGSEHTVNGVASPIEMHIVNWNSDLYSSIADAAVQPGGLAVLGILFEVSQVDNPILEPIITALLSVRDPDHRLKKEIPAMPMNAFIPSAPERYYRYNGSLTTPGCFESVIWTVFHEKQTISRRQLQVFRQVLKPKKHHKRHLEKRSAAHRMHKAEQAMLEELGIENSVTEAARFKRNLENKMETSATETVDVVAMPAETETKPVDQHNGGHHEPEPEPPSGPTHDQSMSLEQQMSVLDRMLVNNYRPVQPLNGRTVYRSFPFFDESATSQTIYYVDMSSSSKSAVTSVTLLICSLVFPFLFQ